MFLPYLHIAAILLNGAKPFEEIVKTLLTEGPMPNLVKIAHAVSEETFKNSTILYMYIMYISQGQGQISPRGQNFDFN